MLVLLPGFKVASYHFLFSSAVLYHKENWKKSENPNIFFRALFHTRKHQYGIGEERALTVRKKKLVTTINYPDSHALGGNMYNCFSILGSRQHNGLVFFHDVRCTYKLLLLFLFYICLILSASSLVILVRYKAAKNTSKK